MSDDKSKTGQDRKLISLTEDYEVRDWCKSLNTTPDKLKGLSRPSAIRRRRYANI